MGKGRIKAIWQNWQKRKVKKRWAKQMAYQVVEDFYKRQKTGEYE